MGADFTSPPAQEAAIEALCATIQQRCVGDNVQYESVASCVDILGKRNFGSWDEVWGDNVVCRYVHVGLTTMRPGVSYYNLSSTTIEIIVFSRWLRPWWARILIQDSQIHCPHVGPTGAMKCVDVSYNKYYFDDQILFGLPEGNAFTCT
jgi:hypothetical protein